MYDITDYYEANSIDEAINILNSHDDVRIIAGGSDVLIKIREGKMAGTSLVSIRNIREIQGVSMADNGDIFIGATTPFSHVTNNEIIKKYIPVLGEAVDKVGGPQVRNIGTIGGNICNGAVSADSAATVFSLDAKLKIANKDGGRVASIQEFYLGPGKVDLKRGEMLTHIIVPKENYDGYTGNYIKYSMREAMDIATLSCSVVCKIDKKNNTLSDVRITFGVAAPTPLRCKQTEQKLIGKSVNDDLYKAIEDSIRQEINPRDSWRASKAFRLQIAGEIAKRALKAAISLQ